MIRAVLSDAYGTLFDLHSVALMAEQFDVQPTATGRLLSDVLSYINLSNRQIANSKE